MHHSLVTGEWVPVRMVLQWRQIRRVMVSNSAVHPASQSCSIESSAPAGKCGKICACGTAFGRDGKFSSHV